MDDNSQDLRLIVDEVKLPREDWKRFWGEIVIDAQWRHRLENLGEIFIDGHLRQHHKLVLFDGAPGTGKSSLAKGFANFICLQMSGNLSCYLANAEAWRSRWVGEPAKLVAKAFQTIRFASRQRNAVVLIIDDVESIAMSRSRTLSVDEPSDIITSVNILLNQLDELLEPSNVLVIATTNLKSSIDKAVIDRCELIVPFSLPNVNVRSQILRQVLKNSPLPKSLTDLDVDKLAEACEGLNGREIHRLPIRASLEKKNHGTIPTIEDYQAAIDVMKSRNQNSEQV